nr:LLM class flavin-dependent oxidoreductase [Rhodococcus opacus PD630]
MVTERVRLGTSVMVAGLHQPLQLAKRFATLDQISGGRVAAGLGTGWAVDEFEAVGVAKSDRGRLLDETLDVFNATWGPDPVNYRGPTRSSTTPTSCRSRLHRSPSSWAAMSTSAPLEVPMHVCCSGSLDVPTVGCHFSRPWRCWCSEASYGVGLDTPVGGRHRARPVQDGNDRGGERHVLRDSVRRRSDRLFRHTRANSRRHRFRSKCGRR